MFFIFQFNGSLQFLPQQEGFREFTGHSQSQQIPQV